MPGGRIGVLGGIGPEATAEFYRKLVQGLQGKGVIKGNRDFPQIIINSIPAPELIHEKISEKELQAYIDGLRELDGFGVDFIVMVCNTIHLFYARLQSEIRTPIVDLREEMRLFLMRNGIKSALVIGTPATVGRGLYRFSGIRYFELDRNDIGVLSSAIMNFNMGIEKQRQAQRVMEICGKYPSAQAIILGCTEFGVMMGGGRTINPIDILVEATILRVFYNNF